MLTALAVLGGFGLDLLLADPAWMPHPVVGMGRAIAALEKRLRLYNGSAIAFRESAEPARC